MVPRAISGLQKVKEETEVSSKQNYFWSKRVMVEHLS